MQRAGEAGPLRLDRGHEAYFRREPVLPETKILAMSSGMMFLRFVSLDR
jgi:hypothetical protein